VKSDILILPFLDKMFSVHITAVGNKFRGLIIIISLHDGKHSIQLFLENIDRVGFVKFPIGNCIVFYLL